MKTLIKGITYVEINGKDYILTKDVERIIRKTILEQNSSLYKQVEEVKKEYSSDESEFYFDKILELIKKD